MRARCHELVRRAATATLLFAAAALGGCPGGEIPNPTSWIIVTTLLDTVDGDTASVAALRANPGADGAISFREALLAVNNTGPGFEIRFLPRGAFTPLSPLPALAAGGTLIEGDGKIAIDGKQRVGLTRAFEVTSAGNRLRGLQIVGFPGDGVVIQGGAATGNRVEGCRIGNDGNNTVRNGGAGVRIRDGASGNTVGGPGAARNVISGNDGWGVAIERGDGVPARANRVEGNLIGVALNGIRALPNRLGGVRIAESRDNTIVGSGAGRNVISGNLGPGIEIAGGAANAPATGNLVRGNLVGTTSNAAPGPGNTVGVRIVNGASGNQVGGNSGPEGNLVAGNRDAGIVVAGGDRNAIRQNTITDNNGVGIRLQDNGNAGMPRPAVTNVSHQTNGVHVIRGTAQAGASVELYIDRGREGELFAGRLSATAQGRFEVQLNLAAFMGRNLNMTATATDRDGNTSEFSNPARIP